MSMVALAKEYGLPVARKGSVLTPEDFEIIKQTRNFNDGVVESGKKARQNIQRKFGGSVLPEEDEYGIYFKEVKQEKDK